MPSPQPPQPPQPQQQAPAPSLLGWLQQLPPWLPPLLWLAGGGTLGAGGLELVGLRQPVPAHQPQASGCVQELAQLQAVTTELVHHLTTCECACARD